MPNKWEPIRDSILAVIEARASDFLRDNVHLKDILKERSERLAKLAFRYATIDDPAVRKELADDMAVVKNTMELEIDAAAVNASASAKGLFKQIASVAFEMLMKSLPGILGAL